MQVNTKITRTLREDVFGDIMTYFNEMDKNKLNDGILGCKMLNMEWYDSTTPAKYNNQ